VTADPTPSPNPPIIETTEIHSPCSRMFTAACADEAGKATLEAAAGYGAVEAHLRLERVPSPSRKVSVSWSGDGGPDPQPPPFLKTFQENARAGKVSKRHPTAEDPRHWLGLPVSGPEKFHGLLMLATPSPPDEPHFYALAGALGCKLAHLASEGDVRRERERNAEWFKTMDAQIRVLEQERQKFAALVNKTDAGIFVASPEGRILWTNPVLSRRYSTLGHGALVGEECRNLCGSESECGDCPIKLVREGSHLVHQERRDKRNGEIRNLYVSAFPVRSPEGRINEVLVMLQDITDLETLRRSEERYQLLFERSTDAIVMGHPETLEIVMANREARRLLEVDGAGPRSLLDLHPGSIRPEMERHYRDLALGQPLENIEVAVRAVAGGELTVNACGTLFDLHGEHVILVEFRDVTYLRRLQSELARADHLITLGTMNAGIAHEFKNRLAPLRAFAQLISMGRWEHDRIRDHAPAMIGEIDRLTALVRDVLDYARPQEPSLETLDFGESVTLLAREFETEFSPLMDGRVSLDLAVPDAAILVALDPIQMRRAFLNLFKNALEAMDSGAGHTLRIHAARGNGGAVLRIEDSGTGIAAGDLERVFDPFFTTKGTKGTGLGMCITKSLIEANGGTIEVRSTLGTGTRVELRFPEATPSQARRFRGGPGGAERSAA
jgi:PAS domain S-box-containing protein